MTTKIDMHLSVRSIDLDFKTGTFKLSGMMSLEWKDPRFTKIESNCLHNPLNFKDMSGTHLSGMVWRASPLPFSTVWTPEVLKCFLPVASDSRLCYKVILHNSMEEKFMFRQVAVLYYTGHIVYAIAIHTKVHLLVFWCS